MTTQASRLAPADLETANAQLRARVAELEALKDRYAQEAADWKRVAERVQADYAALSARLATADRALADMVNQYMGHKEGFVTHEFMSAQEDAIEYLEDIGWLCGGEQERYYWTHAALAATKDDPPALAAQWYAERQKYLATIERLTLALDESERVERAMREDYAKQCARLASQFAQIDGYHVRTGMMLRQIGTLRADYARLRTLARAVCDSTGEQNGAQVALVDAAALRALRAAGEGV